MDGELRQHIIRLLDKGVRLDGRKALEYRKIKVEYNVTKSAEGSARVTMGDTDVITGVKMEVFVPYSDTPDQGSLMVGAELSPLASSEFEVGPPGIEAIEIGRVVDRGLRESHAIDLKKLCIRPGELAWTIVMDICPINHAGNLFDVGALSAIAAVKNTKLPGLKDDKVDYDNKTKEHLHLTKIPLSVTVCKIGNHFIIDPTNEEEKVVDARLTVATVDNGELCALQKGGDLPLSIEDIDHMIGIAIEKCNELRKAL
jgi:exosome complex component RRP42